MNGSKYWLASPGGLGSHPVWDRLLIGCGSSRSLDESQRRQRERSLPPVPGQLPEGMGQ